MPRGRKPGIANKRTRKPYQKEETVEESAPEQIDNFATAVHHLNGIHAALNAIAKLLVERNDLIRETNEKPAEPEVAAKPARKPKAEAPPPAAAPETKPPPAAKSEVVICKHPRDSVTRLDNGLVRCGLCNTVLRPETDAPHLVEEKKPVAPPPPPPPAEVSADDLRACAISFASKHGKPKLAEVLKKYGATNISSVPAESRAALVAELNNAG